MAAAQRSEPLHLTSSGAAGTAPHPALVGAVVGLLTLGAYLPGLGRPFSWDESVTVAGFVRTPSVLDPLRRQIEYNNHPLLSFLDHVIASVAGRSDEVTMRLVPLIAAAAAVGLLTAVCTRKLGVLPGVCAGLMTAANPVVIDVARTARGYALLVLCAVAGSVLLLRLLESGPARARLGAVAYVAVLALGVAAHLSMVLVIAAHAMYVLSARAPVRAWWPRWLVGLGAGLMPYIGLVAAMRASPARGALQPGFLSDLAVQLLGGRGSVALAALPAVAIGLLPPASRAVRLTVAFVSVGVVGIVLVAQPAYLYPRFFVWMAAGAAVLAAMGVRRLPGVGLLVGGSVVVAVVGVVPGYTQGDVANRDAAPLIEEASSAGQRVCADVSQPFLAYVGGPVTVPASPQDLERCDVVVLLYTPSERGLAAVETGRPNIVRLAARQPGVIYSRRPIVFGQQASQSARS